jgi:uncharacterized protein (TIGR03435 family)
MKHDAHINRRLMCFAAAVMVPAGYLLAQRQFKPQWMERIPSNLKFEVASLKPSKPDSPGGGIQPAPGGERYVASGVTLRVLIIVAYRFRPDQIVGGPPWMNTERYDMNAKAERPANVDELHVMLQNLIADQFRFQFHTASRQAPIYVN